MVEGSTRPGTILGEVARSGLMFKSFALSVWMNQYRRILSRPTPLSKAQYAAEMLAAFTAMGALSLQIKEMAKGNDPRPMDSTKFWGAALLQGGGVGIVGDLLAAGDTRMGGGLAEYIAGPVIGFAGDVQRTTVGNVLEFARGEDTNIGRDVSKLVTRNTPVLSSLWYTRTAVDRLLFDELQMLLDPEATASMRASAQRRQREYGTTSFWRDAEPVPYRAPNLLNALGQ